MFLDCSFGLSVLFQFMFFLEFLFAFCWKNRILSYLLLTWQHVWGQASTDSSRQGYGCEWSLSSELGDTADGQERYLVKQNLNFWAKESLSGRVMSSSWEAAHRDWGVSKLDWTQPWATWADYCTFLFPEDPFNLTNSVILWFKPPIILFVQTWAAFFWCRSMFPFGSLPNSCSQPWRLQVALQVTVQRFGRSLSHRVPSCLLSSLLWRCSSRQHSVSHERVPYRWNAFFLCWSWENASVNIDELSLCAWGTGVAIYSTKPVYNLYPASTFL